MTSTRVLIVPADHDQMVAISKALVALVASDQIGVNTSRGLRSFEVDSTVADALIKSGVKFTRTDLDPAPDPTTPATEPKTSTAAGTRKG